MGSGVRTSRCDRRVWLHIAACTRPHDPARETTDSAFLEAADVKVAEKVVVGPSGGWFLWWPRRQGRSYHRLQRCGARPQLAAMRRKLGGNARLRMVVMRTPTQRRSWRQRPTVRERMYTMTGPPGGSGIRRTSGPHFARPSARSGGSQRRRERDADDSVCAVQPEELQAVGQVDEREVDAVAGDQYNEGGQPRVGNESGSKIEVFTLDQHEEATEFAKVTGGLRNYTVIAPNPYGTTSLAI
ncbi:hypothetical protein CTA2_7794 [Colletotrichum tanaceti]|uniref:Uncharacterized protein n=1 Tax=Colletotrichum tanaceti TaxID=1306861 RepID=A0A4U6XN89_9PEZI|nr:hypothetical protein CTA2_7794 [Colletotrichum tanaceti]TKW57203.1 hypothetical protein CTA1_6643 [Colletotrichum tanaceti]